MVANTSLADVELEEAVRISIVTICKSFHESVRLLSERFVKLSDKSNAKVWL